MNEEEKKAIGWLSALDIKSEFEATNKEIILNLIEKQDKMIDYMAKHIDEQNDILTDYDHTISHIPCNTDVPLNKCVNDECENCIKEYFRKRVEEDGEN